MSVHLLHVYSQGLSSFSSPVKCTVHLLRKPSSRGAFESSRILHKVAGVGILQVARGEGMDKSRTLDCEEVEKFLTTLSSYRPAIPDELVRYYLSRAGFQTDDVRLERLISLAAQKFIAEIAHDAISHCRLRQGASTSQSKKGAPKDVKLTLTIDDLERALREYGVVLKKPPYFADNVNAGAPEPAPSKPSAQNTPSATGAQPPASAAVAPGASPNTPKQSK